MITQQKILFDFLKFAMLWGFLIEKISEKISPPTKCCIMPNPTQTDRVKPTVKFYSPLIMWYITFGPQPLQPHCIHSISDPAPMEVIRFIYIYSEATNNDANCHLVLQFHNKVIDPYYFIIGCHVCIMCILYIK